MSTFMAKPADIQRKWYIIDAADRPLGRTAAKVADILRGKIKPEFTPHVDCGDHVIVINAAKVVLTGKKLEQKKYYRYSGYVGGLKETSARDMLATKPEKVVYEAIKGMMPKNSLGRNMLTKLRVYSGAEHEHAAQKPETYTI